MGHDRSSKYWIPVTQTTSGIKCCEKYESCKKAGKYGCNPMSEYGKYFPLDYCHVLKCSAFKQKINTCPGETPA